MFFVVSVIKYNTVIKKLPSPFDFNCTCHQVYEKVEWWKHGFAVADSFVDRQLFCFYWNTLLLYERSLMSFTNPAIIFIFFVCKKGNKKLIFLKNEMKNRHNILWNGYSLSLNFFILQQPFLSTSSSLNRLTLKVAKTDKV